MKARSALGCALLVVAIATGSALMPTATTETRMSDLVCPTTTAQELPPTNVPGFDPARDLLPASVPTHALVCRYPGPTAQIAQSAGTRPSDPVLRLGGSRVLRSAAATNLAAPLHTPLPNDSCRADEAATAAYLVGFAYPQGQAWVRVPAGCADGVANTHRMDRVLTSPTSTTDGLFTRRLDDLFRFGAGQSASPCPDSTVAPHLEPAVPQQPPQAVRDRLVPPQLPTSAWMCRYEPVVEVGHEASAAPKASTRRFEGAVELLGDLGGLRDLAWARRAPGPLASKFCTTMGGPVTPYLLRLSYPSGDVWIYGSSDPNYCAGASNGAFTTGAYLGAAFDEAYRSAHWPAAGLAESRNPCQNGLEGRLGDDAALVPGNGRPVSVTVCLPRGRPAVPITLDDGTSRAVLDALRALPTQPGNDMGCTSNEQLHRSYFLRINYADGPPAWVMVGTGCVRGVSNQAISAVDATTVLAPIDAALTASGELAKLQKQ